MGGFDAKDFSAQAEEEAERLWAAGYKHQASELIIAANTVKKNMLGVEYFKRQDEETERMLRWCGVTPPPEKQN